MNISVIEKLFEILPTLYLDEVPSNYEQSLYKCKELVKNLSNSEKIKLYQTEMELEESQDIIELCVLLNDIWQKDYLFSKKLKQKKEFIEIYLKDTISPKKLNLVFEILDNCRIPNKYFGKYEILKDIVTDVLNLELLNLDIIDKLIIHSYKNNSTSNVCKFISNKCKDEIFRLKDLIRTSYAKEIAINSEKQLKLIVLNYDFLSNHVKTRTNVLKKSNYF